MRPDNAICREGSIEGRKASIWHRRTIRNMTDASNGTAGSSPLGERAEIKAIAASHGARNVRIFGSVQRGDAGTGSDLDLLVDMAEGRNLFDLVALSEDLQEALGVDVDVVTEGSLSPYLRDTILAEAVAL